MIIFCDINIFTDKAVSYKCVSANSYNKGNKFNTFIKHPGLKIAVCGLQATLKVFGDFRGLHIYLYGLQAAHYSIFSDYELPNLRYVKIYFYGRKSILDSSCETQ